MKTLAILTLTLFSLSSFGSVAFELEGPIQNQNGKSFIITQENRVELQKVSTCEYGRFLVVNGLEDDSVLNVVEVIECSKEPLCSKIFSPVCGELKGQKVIFGNTCELYQSNAQFLDYGNCH